MVSPEEPLSVKRQCELLDLPRSTFYYQPKPVGQGDLDLMKKIDAMHLERPFYGSRRLRDWLQLMGYAISRKKIQRLMREMGLCALYPKRNLSKRNQAHKVYPYLLKGLVIDRPNQVWSTDITFVPMAKGFLYLVAVIDWYSRKVLAWELSNSMDVRFCVEALETALRTYGAPEIFNTDQGSQFTSEAFTSALKAHEIRISMDGKGRWVDNVFVERLWRSLKYEEVYLRGYSDVAEARRSISSYFEFFNRERIHQSLNRQTPDQVYYTLAGKRMAA